MNCLVHFLFIAMWSIFEGCLNKEFNDYMNRDKEILRCELYLRAEYPHLKTRIFKLKNDFYTIYADNYPKPFSSFEDKFHNQIRPITVPVSLTETIPENFEKEITPLSDTDIVSDYSGIPFSSFQLQRLIQFKFPNINCICITHDNSDYIDFYIQKISDEDSRLKFINFLKSLELNLPFKIIDDEKEIDTIILKEKQRKEKLNDFYRKNPSAKNFEESLSNPVLNMIPLRQQSLHIKAEERDEEQFFYRLENIYKGIITKHDILPINRDSLNCYIDYSMTGCENINIRNGVLLYDKVFIDLPLMESIESFCNRQKVKKDDLLDLCNRGKVNFILTHPSIQYDRDFLETLYSTAPNSIITRRLLSSLIIADLVDINKNYFINTVDGLLESSFDFANLIADTLHKEKEDVYKFLIWPQMALRNSFECLLFNSPTRIASFGINNTFLDFPKLFDKEKGEKLELEFMINSDKVHIASALNSVYFPYSEKNGKYTNRPTTSLMADRLNFYKNATIDTGSEYFNDRNKILSGMQNILPIDIIDVNDYIPLHELQKVSDCFYTSSQFNSIFSFLAKQDVPERIEIIKKYNNLVDKEINKKRNTKTSIDFAINGAFDGVGGVLSALNIFFPVIGLATTGIKLLAEKSGLNETILKKFEKTQKIMKNGNYNEEKAISFLAKINPVARFNIYN